MIKCSQINWTFLKNEGEAFQVKAMDSAVVLVFSGESIHEPISAHGSFVMNTQAQLEQAFIDFNDGKFGFLND